MNKNLFKMRVKFALNPENGFRILCRDAGNFGCWQTINPGQFFDHIDDVTAFVALAAERDGREIRRIGLEYNILDANLVQELVDLAVLERDHAADAEFHVERNGLQRLLVGSRETVENTEKFG